MTSPQAEAVLVRGALRNYGYPEWALNEGEQRGEGKLRKSPRHIMDQIKGKRRAEDSLQCSPTWTRSLSAYRESSRNMTLSCTPRQDTIWNLNAVVSPKDPLDMCEQCGVIYECGCELCRKLYVEETGRSIGERLEEHTKPLARGDGKSALS